MKITAEDPVLTAYALGELDEPTRASVKAAMAQDESLAREGEAITSLGGLLTQTFQGEGFSLGEERRAEILKAGRRPDADVLVLDHRKRSRRQSFMVVAGVAAVVVPIPLTLPEVAR
jgi:anti-sigma factor RsiW